MQDITLHKYKLRVEFLGQTLFHKLVFGKPKMKLITEDETLISPQQLAHLEPVSLADTSKLLSSQQHKVYNITILSQLYQNRTNTL